MSKPVFIRKKCPRCGAKMALADNNDPVSFATYFFNREVFLVIAAIVIVFFNDSFVAWIIAGLACLIAIVIFMTINPYRDFKCSKCEYDE